MSVRLFVLSSVCLHRRVTEGKGEDLLFGIYHLGITTTSNNNPRWNYYETSKAKQIRFQVNSKPYNPQMKENSSRKCITNINKKRP